MGVGIESDSVRCSIRRAACVLTILTLTRSAAADGEPGAQALRDRARVAFEHHDYGAAAHLLSRASAMDPSDPAVLRDLAVVLAANGSLDESVERYAQYLARVPGDDAARLAMATTLSWSKDPRRVAEAERLLTALLDAHPHDDATLLQRARARSWANRLAASVSDYHAYLAMKPGDEAARLELARVLSWSGRADDAREAVAILERHVAARPGDDAVALELAKALTIASDEASLERALRIYDADFARHPRRVESALGRARARAALGRTEEAVQALDAYARVRPDDDRATLEIANVLAQRSDPSGSIPLYDLYVQRHPADVDARTRRARALLWAGEHRRAEGELDALRREARSDEERDTLDLDLGRLYAQTERPFAALDRFDGVLARDPTNEAARRERARVSARAGSRTEPRFFYYGDTAGVSVVALTAENRARVMKNVAVLSDAGAWSLGSRAEVLRTGRANLGAWVRLAPFELEAAAGPRAYERYAPSYGGRAAVRAAPAGWMKLALEYQYDDLYVDLYQPASIAAGIRGHALHAMGNATLPLRVRVSGRAGVRSVLADNRALDAGGTVLVPVFGPVSAGYSAQFLTWSSNDPSYWSPQAFASHLGVVRVAKSLFHGDLAYDVQGVAGIAGERISGAADPKFGPSFGGSCGISYAAGTRVVLRVAAQYAQTIRELTNTAVPVGESRVAPKAAPTITTSLYWWVSTTGSVIVYL